MIVIIKQIPHILSSFNKKINNDHVGAYAGQATLFILISTFPFLMFLLSLIQYLPITESNIMSIVNNIFPNHLSPIFISIISEVFDRGSTTLVSITGISALWSASRGFLTLTKGLNKVYDTDETRGYLRTRILASLYTLAFAVIIIITLSLLVFGNRIFIFIENVFPILTETALIIISLRAVMSLAILTFFFLILFLVVPDRKSTISDELPGATLAAIGWMIFSYVYSCYIDSMANMTDTYGSLTAIVLLMLWLYFCMYILFIGAEINVLVGDKFNKKKSIL